MLVRVVRARRHRLEAGRSRALRGPLRSGRARLRPSRRLRRAFPADARAHRVAAQRRRHVPGAAAGVSRARDARASGVAARRGRGKRRRGRAGRDGRDGRDGRGRYGFGGGTEERTANEGEGEKRRDGSFRVTSLGRVRAHARACLAALAARRVRAASVRGGRRRLVSVSFVVFSRLARVRARDAAPLRDALVRGHRAHEEARARVGAAHANDGRERRARRSDATERLFGLFGLFGRRASLSLSFVRRRRRKRARGEGGVRRLVAWETQASRRRKSHRREGTRLHEFPSTRASGNETVPRRARGGVLREGFRG